MADPKEQAVKQERRAAALRANLKRRKTQTRERETEAREREAAAAAAGKSAPEHGAMDG